MDLERIIYHHCYFEEVPDLAKSHFHTPQNRITKVCICLWEPWYGTNKLAFVNKSSTIPGTQCLLKYMPIKQEASSTTLPIPNKPWISAPRGQPAYTGPSRVAEIQFSRSAHSTSK